MIEINPFDPVTLVLIALLNPAVIAVAFVLGRKADQWQKLIVAAFASALCGFVLYWLGGQVGLLSIHALGGEASVLVIQTVLGLVWASIGYYFRAAPSAR
ncbi:MAG: hypothetical protein WC807_18965 [Hyphomicrobium sp.]|jgi:membrane protein YqaA with SNARE-associated domain